MREARNPNPAIAASIAAVAAIAFAGTFWFDPVPPGLPGLGAADFPRLICLVLFGLAALLALTQGQAPSEDDAPRLDGGAWAVFGACALFVPALEILGIWGAIPLYLVIVGRIWGGVSVVTLGLNAAGLTLALWLVFSKIFRLTLPTGWLGAALGG
ncbi:tripartite tricarboxylate transporter TctB family protein [Neoroseomonas rubea]|uniref:tripartite tricarboxylate transporter TctB family protein n=1 Tax=Neoroseomonas rubea TaxID=2748666 RepID=UPI0018DFF751|nr:tripartite tricarboxylate transporter TctB family protein [Roseomonas rubea]